MNDQNIIEGEDMIISNITGDGSSRIRPIPVPDKPNWTKSAMVWTHAMSGDSITFQFICEDPGRYGITGYYFVRNGNTRLNFLINGETVLTAPGKQKRSMEDDPAILTAVELSEGYNEMIVIVMGATQPDPEKARFWQWSFGKKAKYFLKEDTYCINNLAGDSANRELILSLRNLMETELKSRRIHACLAKETFFITTGLLVRVGKMLTGYEKYKTKKERNIRNHVEGKFGQGKTLIRSEPKEGIHQNYGYPLFYYEPD